MTTTRRPTAPSPPSRAGAPDAGRGARAAAGTAWTLVARREIATRLVDRTFLVGTVLTLVLIAGFVVVQAVLADRVKDYDLVATPAAAAMAHAGRRPGRRDRRQGERHAWSRSPTTPRPVPR